MDAEKVDGLLILLGVVGFFAAIVGSGIEAGPVKFPSIPTSRQIALGVLSTVVAVGGVIWWAVQQHHVGAQISEPTAVETQTSETPPKILGELTYLDTERNVSYRSHLVADRLSLVGYDARQLKRVGNVVRVGVSLVGLQGKKTPLVWSLYRVSGRNRQPVSDDRYLNQPAQPVSLEAPAGEFAASLDVWIPVPPFRGEYVGRIELLYENITLRSVDSLPFAGKPQQPSSSPLAVVPEPAAGTRCGVERWSVKTLTDPAATQVDPQPRMSSVHNLIRLSRPGALTERRSAPVELSTYRVRVRLVEFKLEDDSDVKLVVADPATGETMIVEFPSDGCTKTAAVAVRTRMSRARAALLRVCGPPSSNPDLRNFVRLTGTATISGVGFFDFIHGQAGAPNGIELHPAVEFRSSSCQTR